MLLYTCSNVSIIQFISKLNTYWLSEKPLRFYGKYTYLVDVTLPPEKQKGYSSVGYEKGVSAWGINPEFAFTKAYSITPDLINRVWRLYGEEDISKIKLKRPDYINSICLFKDRNLYILGQTNMVMLDWDMPDNGHKTDLCITINQREDVLPIVNKYVEANPNCHIILEKTPGGVRGWELSRPYTPSKGVCLQQQLNCDSLYSKNTLKYQYFCTRVSKKAGKEYVSKYWMTLGGGNIHPDVYDSWEQYRRLVKYFNNY